MQNTVNKNTETPHQRLARWRAMHPEMTDREFAEAIHEVQSYLKVAWRVFRAKNKHDNLPDEL
jgi:hypothetical protein